MNNLLRYLLAKQIQAMILRLRNFCLQPTSSVSRDLAVTLEVTVKAIFQKHKPYISNTIEKESFGTRQGKRYYMGSLRAAAGILSSS